MKILLIVLISLLLTACGALGQFSNFMLGENTTNTVKTCTADGECIEIDVDGTLTTSEMLLIASRAAAAKEAANETPQP